MGNRMVWINEELADKLEIVNDVAKIKNDDLDKVIKRLSDETKSMSECLDENVLRFKLHAQQVRDNYEKVVNEEVDKTYELWEKCDELRSKTREKIDTLLPIINSVNGELRSLNQSIEKINTYGIEKLIDLVERFKSISDKEKDMLAHLLNYKNL